jgi:hypothetical protein
VAGLLTLVSDPKGVKQLLADMAGVQARVQEGIAKHDAAKQRADEAIAKLASLEHDKANVEQRAAALDKRATELDVAGAAQARRDQQLDAREQELNARAADLARDTKAHQDRVAELRKSLV